MRVFATTASCALVASLAAAPAQQDPPGRPPQTPFRTAIELVSVDVNVMDRGGRPVDGLQETDFSLIVDGKPRRVTSAEFVRLSRPSTPPPAPSHYSSNAHTGAGRLVALVIDQGNISAGRARAATESAIRFIKKLSPADRVGLFVIPGPGARIGFTSNHALVQAQLPTITGHMAAAFAPRLGLGEATSIERGDQIALNTVADRECTASERLVCMQELAAEARELTGEARDRARNSLGPLRALLEQLAESKLPKTIIYLSEGLIIDQDRSELAWLGPLAAKGRVSLHVLRIDAPVADSAASRRSFSRREDIAVAEEGLSLLAGLTRGSLYRVAGNADNIFNRLSLEMSGYYLLGFEPEEGDRDGKPHKIKIEVPGRRGLTVRARQDFAVEAARVLSTEEAVAETLRSPVLATDIGLKVTAYTFRDAASRKLRIVIAADIDRSQNPSGSLSLGYALLDARGTVVSSQFERQLTTPLDAERMTQHFVAAANGDTPGVYGLKVAVVDETGKRGSVEHAFRAQLTTAGEVHAGDLLIGDTASAGVSGAAPTVAADFTDAETLHGYIELYADSQETLRRATVTLEISNREDSRALESAPVRFEDATSSGGRKAAEGVLPISLLPPGDYYARAVISIGGRTAGQVGRPFRVSRTTTLAGAVPGRGRIRSRGAAPFTLRVEPFHRSAVLTPEVIGFFVSRMGGEGRGTTAPAEALEHARAGKFEAASGAARRSGHALAAVFLEGLTLYAHGQLDEAAVKFREAIRLDSEFFPAAFYLGACYAAGGRDREASAAWQTSLVTESDAPFVYTLLGDAWLRQREMERALDILNEASQRWPDAPEVQMRLAGALAMSGKSAEALRVLEAYLVKQPSDAERLFLALRVIYEAHAAGRTIGSREEDRARFDRYATAYAAAAGPQLALVEQWRTFMSRQAP